MNRTFKWILCSILLTLSSLGSASEATRERESGCYRASAQGEVQRVASAVQYKTDEVLLPAFFGDELLRFSLDGRLLERHRLSGEGGLQLNQPTIVRQVGSRIILQNSMWEWIWLNEALEPESSVRFLQRSSSPDLISPLVQLAIHDFIPIGDDAIFAFAYIRRKGEELAERYYARLEIVSSRVQLVDLVTKIDGYAASSRFYSNTFPLLARAGDGVYGLSFGKPHAILRVDQGGQVLKSFPYNFRSTPSLPQFPGSMEGSRLSAAALERMAVPRALYGREKFLYLLTRSPTKEGKTRWELSQIDPIADRLTRTLVLPTSAAGLDLVPGTEKWLLLEQGAMEDLGRPLKDWVTVPAEWIEDPTSTVLSREKVVECARRPAA